MNPRIGLGAGRRSPRVDADGALELLRRHLSPLPQGVHVEEDETGSLAVFVRRDMFHLDADALNDRLHAWVVREVHATLPQATALVSFRHAVPVSNDEPELEFEEPWRHLEPTFRLDLTPQPTEEEVARFARFVPRFLSVVAADGRPEGWREPEVGNAE